MGAQKSCLSVENDEKITLERGMDSKIFTFDYVATPETMQEPIFLRIAQPIADACLQGYNGTIFAYGQTGSGKTFTIQGPTVQLDGEETIVSNIHSGNKEVYEMRGLMQRSFEYIFDFIESFKRE